MERNDFLQLIPIVDGDGDVDGDNQHPKSLTVINYLFIGDILFTTLHSFDAVLVQTIVLDYLSPRDPPKKSFCEFSIFSCHNIV